MEILQFIDNFSHIVDAPGGLKRIRDLVLTLAFKGKLCEASGETTGSLTAELQRQRMLFAGEHGKQQLVSGLEFQRSPMPPFEIPGHWTWLPLSAVGHTWGQKEPSEPFTYIDVSSIDSSRGQIASPDVRSSDQAPSRARKIVKRGSIIYATVRPYLLNTAVVDRDFKPEPIASTAFAVVHPWDGILAQYIHFYLRSPSFTNYVESVQAGIAYPAISDQKFYSGLVPVPPTTEQQRIADKVGELMALCDRLEAQQKSRRQVQRYARQSTLESLAKANDHKEAAAAGERLLENFSLLFSESKDVTALKRLILSLAIRGRLSRQLPTDTPARSLLQAVAVERAHFRKDGRLPRMALEVPTEKYPYPLPVGWCWARVSDVVDVGTGATPATTEPTYYGGEIPWFTSSATSVEYARTPEKFITLKALSETNCKVFPAGSLIVAMYGQGKTRGQVSELLVDGATNQAIAALVFPEASAGAKRYIKHFFGAIYDAIRDEAEGGPQPNLNVRKIKETLIPLPPIQEQQRIIACIDGLLARCAQLRDQFEKQTRLGRDLAIAIAAFLGGYSNNLEEANPMRAPEIELSAPVQMNVDPEITRDAPLCRILSRNHGRMSARDLWHRFGGEIDSFYAQLKTEVSNGWIREPEEAEIRERAVDSPEN